MPSLPFFNELLVLGLATLLSLVLTGLSIPIARRAGMIDIPGGVKTHQAPTPRFGGLGIAGALVILASMGNMLGLGILAIAVTGCVDDRFTLRPLSKLVGQFAAGVLMGIHFLNNGYGWFFAWLAVIVTVVLTNAVNLLDGLDGLAGGTTIVMSLGLALISIRCGIDPAIELILAGASLGFLVWNYPPAKTFMGDTGSLVIGYVLAYSVLKIMATDVTAGLGARRMS